MQTVSPTTSRPVPPTATAAPLTLLKLTPPCRENASMKRRYASNFQLTSSSSSSFLCVRRRADSKRVERVVRARW